MVLIGHEDGGIIERGKTVLLKHCCEEVVKLFQVGSENRHKSEHEQFFKIVENFAIHPFFLFLISLRERGLEKRFLI
jgi:hypothetical protein